MSAHVTNNCVTNITPGKLKAQKSSYDLQGPAYYTYFLPIMLCCSATYYSYSILCSIYFIVLIFLCIDCNLFKIRFFAIANLRVFVM